MTTSMTHKEISPKYMGSIVLPAFDGQPPGPIHTLLFNEDGTCCYSDEMNHMVVCLNRKGEPLWRRGGYGCRQEEFIYPRGLSWGWILNHGVAQQCLAVCDAWNHRLKLLDKNGNTLAIWDHVKTDSFLEITDVRYICDSNPALATRGYWLVLDRGKHRIVALGLDGMFLFQIGREINASLSKHWAMPGLFLNDDISPGYIKAYPPFDYTFFPSRILGQSEQALFIWEPASRSLKQILHGNLLPVTIPEAENTEWLSADDTGLVAWDRRSQKLIIIGRTGRFQYRLNTSGPPGYVNLRQGEFWMQVNREIQHWAWSKPIEEIPQTQEFALLHLSAKAEIDRSDPVQIQSVIDKKSDALKKLLIVADELLALTKSETIDIEYLLKIRSQLLQLRQHHHQSLAEFQRGFHHYCLNSLFLHIAASFPALMEPTEMAENHGAVLEPWIIAMRRNWDEIQHRLEMMYLFRLGILEQKQRSIAAEDFLDGALRHLEQELEEFSAWLYLWSGYVDCATEALPLPCILMSSESTETGGNKPGIIINRPPAFRKWRSTAGLREVDRIGLNDSSMPSPLKPHSLARSFNNEILVSLYGAHTVVRLDYAGKRIGYFGRFGTKAGELNGPTGLAVDQDHRIWIAEYTNHRIHIFDGQTAYFFGSYGSVLGQFNHPTGLFARSDGVILTADTANHRIVSIRHDGTCEIFCNRIGSALDELNFPHTFYSDIHDGLPLLTDIRNHRILKLHNNGSFQLILGKRGLDSGKIYRPSHVAVFDDGTMVVNQNQLDCNLKLFSPAGKALGKLILDYIPGGMLAIDDRLFVADFSGDFLRVYKKSP